MNFLQLVTTVLQNTVEQTLINNICLSYAVCVFVSVRERDIL